MKDITPLSNTAPHEAEERHNPYAPGNWVWVKDKKWNSEKQDHDEYEWLGCIIDFGSNYVLIEAPAKPRSYGSTVRVHNDKLETKLRPEPNADQLIADLARENQQEVMRLMGEVQQVMLRIGVAPKTAVADHSNGGGNALAVVTQQVDTDAYKNALEVVKKDELPALYKGIEEANARLAKWMLAPTLPLQAKVRPMKESISAIDDRIYTIELYAGLTEDAVKIKDGDPANTYEPLRVMQRKHYMDEECLLDYDAGGMEFADIKEFNEWFVRPHNLERMLPFERCCVAFQVRRGEKQRHASTLLGAFINIQLAQQDKWTYLYVRNGEQVWCIACDLEFGDKIFPDADQYDPVKGGHMMLTFGGKVDKLITRNEYEVRMAEHEEKMAEWRIKVAEWHASNPEGQHWRAPSEPRAPWADDRIEPLDPTSVYFDDGIAMLDKEIKEFNRIAVIIQGLFDRSLSLHPHPPVSVWDPESFNRSVKLIYDSTTLTYGEAPDFEAYRAELNKSIGEGSVTIGQRKAWGRREAERENARISRSWREDTTYHEEYYPYGDPGPSKIMKIDEWKPRARKAVFRWTRESRNWRVPSWERADEVKCSVTVDAADLFNVSAYKPGDYLRFYRDHRTRQQYLQWAPFLLAAEAYHAGKDDKFK